MFLLMDHVQVIMGAYFFLYIHKRFNKLSIKIDINSNSKYNYGLFLF